MTGLPGDLLKCHLVNMCDNKLTVIWEYSQELLQLLQEQIIQFPFKLRNVKLLHPIRFPSREHVPFIRMSSTSSPCRSTSVMDIPVDFKYGDESDVIH